MRVSEVARTVRRNLQHLAVSEWIKLQLALTMDWKVVAENSWTPLNFYDPLRSTISGEPPRCLKERERERSARGCPPPPLEHTFSRNVRWTRLSISHRARVIFQRPQERDGYRQMSILGDDAVVLSRFRRSVRVRFGARIEIRFGASVS